MARMGLLLSALLLAAGAWASEGRKGQDLYSGKCASCHGKDGKGNPAMAKVFKVDLAKVDLVDEGTLAKKDEDLAAATTKGTGKMPAFSGKLTDAQIVDVLAYVRSLAAPPGVAEKGEARGPDLAAAAAAFKAKCASCHGKDGKGSPAMGKTLKVESPALDLTDEPTQMKTEEELSGILTEKGKSKPDHSAKLMAEEVPAMIGYLRSVAGVKPVEKPKEAGKP